MSRNRTIGALGRVDLRFVLGIALVLASVIGVVTLVQSLNHTVTVYVTATTIPTGAVVTVDDLKVEQVSLGLSAERYLSPADTLTGQVARHALPAGELIAKSAITRAAPNTTITTVIAVTGTLPESVRVGSTVDVWAAPTGSTRTTEAVEPTTVLTGVEVVRITEASGFAATNSTDVELRIPRTGLEGVLLAQAMGLGFTIVTVGVTP